MSKLGMIEIMTYLEKGVVSQAMVVEIHDLLEFEVFNDNLYPNMFSTRMLVDYRAYELLKILQINIGMKIDAKDLGNLDKVKPEELLDVLVRLKECPQDNLTESFHHYIKTKLDIDTEFTPYDTLDKLMFSCGVSDDDLSTAQFINGLNIESLIDLLSTNDKYVVNSIVKSQFIKMVKSKYIKDYIAILENIILDAHK